MISAEAVRSYKALAEVERAFRSMKTIDLHIRPIHHHLEGRVRATSSYACSPITSNGTCARRGAS